MIDRNDHGPVRHLRLNRPPANALSPELVSALGEELIRAPDDGVRALVISGRPGMFSAGLDVPYLLRLDHHRIRAAWDGFYRMLQSLAASPIPVVAAITGHAPAGGTVIAMFCDRRVMADGDYKLGLNEVRVGIPLPPILYRALERLVGERCAERLAVNGEMLGTAEALACGLIDEIVPAAEVEERALGWCRDFLALPPTAARRTRELARQRLVGLFGDDVSQEVEGLVTDWFSPETQSTLHALVARLTQKGK